MILPARHKVGVVPDHEHARVKVLAIPGYSIAAAAFQHGYASGNPQSVQFAARCQVDRPLSLYFARAIVFGECRRSQS
jgi:hypothetical protein